MTKLSDIQTLLLTTAATREDGSLLPPPDLLGAISTPIRKAIAGLIRRGFAEEMAVISGDAIWRTDGDSQVGLAITDAGRAAIGHPLPERVVPEAAAPTSKIGKVVDLLKREQGVTLDEIVQTTGWLPHTTRAALTGLRKKGHVILRTVSDAGSCYRIAEAA